MPEPTNGDASSVGVALAKDLVENLVLSNRNAEINRAILVEVRDTLDDLCGRLEVVSRTMELLHEMRGKKLTMADLAECWTIAEDEIFGDDDGDGETEEEPDPVVDGGRA